jgi:small subunit ribosomal protein S21
MLIIPIKNGNIETALKKFKSKIIKTKLITQLQERKTYTKPSDEKRELIKNAIYKESKNLDN